MTPLVWANFPLMLLVSAAIIGIPAWMIYKRVDRPADHSEAHDYLGAKAELQRRTAAGGPAPAQVSTMAAAAVPATSRRGHWRLAPPRPAVAGRRPATAGRTTGPRDRSAATRRRRTDA